MQTEETSLLKKDGIECSIPRLIKKTCLCGLFDIRGWLYPLAFGGMHSEDRSCALFFLKDKLAVTEHLLFCSFRSKTNLGYHVILIKWSRTNAWFRYCILTEPVQKKYFYGVTDTVVKTGHVYAHIWLNRRLWYAHITTIQC